jgi:polysaccharide biosynthesis transport protein
VSVNPPVTVQAQRPSAFLRLLRVLRERWWIVALSALVCTLTALAFSLTAPKEYEASASLLFRDPGFSEPLFGSDVFKPSLDPARESSTNLLLVESREVAGAVRRELGLDESTSDLLDKVSVEERTNADIVEIRARDENPRLAARIAGEFATQYVLFRQRADRRKIADAEELIRNRLEDLPPDSTAARTQLEEALQRLIALGAVQTGNAEVIDRPEVPTVAASPQTKRDVAVALFVGLILGVAIALLVDFLDRRVKSAEEFEELYRVPTLSTVPQSTFAAKRKTMQGAPFEPFRILYSGLGFLSVAGPIRVLMVTSAVAEEGKTSVAVNLARAVALSRRSVALVEADLRRPSFRGHFGTQAAPAGLTNALVSHQSVAELIQHVPPTAAFEEDEGSALAGLGDQPGMDGTIALVRSGPIPPNSAELLRSEGMGQVLEELAETHDMVIVDAPPLLPIADAQVLLAHEMIDACLIVARVYKTTRDQARRTRAILDQHRIDRIGLVVTGVRERPGGYEYYERLDGDAAAPAEPSGRRSRRKAAT